MFISPVGAMAITDGTFGVGEGAIHFDNLACIGSETSVFDCVVDTDTSDCSHVQDAGIICSLNSECRSILILYIKILFRITTSLLVECHEPELTVELFPSMWLLLSPVAN